MADKKESPYCKALDYNKLSKKWQYGNSFYKNILCITMGFIQIVAVYRGR